MFGDISRLQWGKKHNISHKLWFEQFSNFKNILIFLKLLILFYFFCIGIFLLGYHFSDKFMRHYQVNRSKHYINSTNAKTFIIYTSPISVIFFWFYYFFFGEKLYKIWLFNLSVSSAYYGKLVVISHKYAFE